MTWVEIVSAVLGLSCVFLAGRNSKYNFYVGYVYNVFLFVLFMHQHLYSAMILQPISLMINAYGHWRWTHPREEERSAADRCWPCSEPPSPGPSCSNMPSTILRIPGSTP